MSNVIDTILDVKALREDRANTEVRRRRYALGEAARRVETRKKELADYRTWRVGREVEMYDTIQLKKVRLRQIEELHEQIAEMRATEALKGEHLLEARQAHGAARQALDDAIETHAQAVRARQKFEEVSVVFEQEARLEQERLEEIELEDVHPPVEMEI